MIVNGDNVHAYGLFVEHFQKNEVIWNGQNGEVVQMVRERIGPVSSFKTAMIVKRLPKTRSGKILRGILQKIADAEEYKMPATIDDPAILALVRVRTGLAIGDRLRARIAGRRVGGDRVEDGVRVDAEEQRDDEDDQAETTTQHDPAAAPADVLDL